MTLKSQLAADVSAVFMNTGEFAESVTYRPLSGGSLARSAVFVEEQDAPVEADSKGWLKRMRRAELRIADDATTGITAPKLADKIDVRGETWRVESFEKDIGMWRLTLLATEDIDRTTGHVMGEGT